ncbi:MAG TPA: cytochrome bc complex cytochrome b subunit [Bacteroidota bacterium]|nr:cytochrome bc complex cytochrome b subunit [Bacteroidota bacterium]
MAHDSWLNDRLRYRTTLELLARKLVPQHRHSFWYFFGGLSFFFFVIQIVTGMLLLVYYSPTPETAHESVSFLMTQVPYGWLIRSVHGWSANLMIGCVLVHLVSTFFMKAYRRPRESMWVTGVVLLFLVMGFGFTGYLLPWDTVSYFATQIGTEIPRSIPVIGSLAVKLIRGGDYIAADSLRRMFALHVVILPLISIILVAFHLILNQVHGSSVPLRTNANGPGIPFYPNYLFRDLIAWTIALGAAVILALLLPVSLGPKAEPMASAPGGIRPEWYFLSLYETLRLLPGEILGMNTEMLVNVGVGIATLVLLLVPFLDRRAHRGEPSPVYTWIGIFTILYIGVSTTLAYLT